MHIEKELAKLKAERQQIEDAAQREQIDEAILTLERIARHRAGGPGRPPNWMTDDVATAKRRGRPPGSKNKVHQPHEPDDPPPAAAMCVPRHRNVRFTFNGR
jgi:hypothetical protein